MIVKMKKVTLFTSVDHRDQALKVLMHLGVLHVKSHTTSSSDTSYLEEQITRLNHALSRIGRVEHHKTLEKTPEEVVVRILELDEMREALLLEKEEVEAKLAVFKKWHNVSLQSIFNLEESGVFVRLYSIENSEYDDELLERDDLYKLGEDGENILLAHITTNENEKLDLKQEFLPEERRRDLLDQHYKIAEKLSEVNGKLDFYGNYEQFLRNHLEVLSELLHYARIKAGMENVKELCYLQGFVPYDQVDEIKTAADEQKWAYLIEDVTEEDDAPTLIRNPKWVSIIDPIFKFFGTVPGYGEQDISFWFLLFFSLFFAMLIGDAGYGFIFLVITFIAQKKIKNVSKKPFILMYVLCLGAITWGVLVGNYFGSSTLGTNPFLRQFVIEKLANFQEDGRICSSKESIELMMRICFAIGVVHLTIAHLIAAWKKLNHLKCIADFGWVIILWGLYGLVKHLIFKDTFPTIAGVFIAVGFVLALLFENFESNNAKGLKQVSIRILKGMQETIIQLPLGLISGFSDLISYVRLFAVGYTALVLANSFNNMASDFNYFWGAIILFFGHGLNLLLCGLGVLVHGVRLKMLEFSGHVGNEWTGVEYNPFREPESEIKVK